jgi:hypothetical protein
MAAITFRPISATEASNKNVEKPVDKQSLLGWIKNPEAINHHVKVAQERASSERPRIFLVAAISSAVAAIVLTFMVSAVFLVLLAASGGCAYGHIQANKQKELAAKDVKPLEEAQKLLKDANGLYQLASQDPVVSAMIDKAEQLPIEVFVSSREVGAPLLEQWVKGEKSAKEIAEGLFRPEINLEELRPKLKAAAGLFLGYMQPNSIAKPAQKLKSFEPCLKPIFQDSFVTKMGAAFAKATDGGKKLTPIERLQLTVTDLVDLMTPKVKVDALFASAPTGTSTAEEISEFGEKVKKTLPEAFATFNETVDKILKRALEKK